MDRKRQIIVEANNVFAHSAVGRLALGAKSSELMLINADKTQAWKDDVAASVDMFNAWFMDAAPQAFKETREKVTDEVQRHLVLSNDCRDISGALLVAHPQTVGTLRMAACPPLANERLSGLAGVARSLVQTLEGGTLPRGSKASVLADAERIAGILLRLVDRDLFPWLESAATPTEAQRYRAATIVADRRCTAVANPIVKNAQEQRQLALIRAHLESRGYSFAKAVADPKAMAPGTFSFRMVVPTFTEGHAVKIPVDVVIQPFVPRADLMPILVECKSAGDFTNVNKRRKEEAQKLHLIRRTYGDDVPFFLFLCGYFDAGYLGYSASEGMDWVWEHRMADLDRIGI